MSEIEADSVRRVTDAARQVSRARAAARRAVAQELGRTTASGNLAADRIGDKVLSALSYRDPNHWPTREEVEVYFAAMRSAAPEALDPAGWRMPTVYIQWKGTKVCLDLHCECAAEEFGHFDGFDAYTIECHNCGRKYRLPDTLTLEPDDGQHPAQLTRGN